MKGWRGLFNRAEKTPVFITAEIGINHEGNFDQARRLMALAAKSGADAVKFQVFKTGEFIHPELSKAGFDLFRTFELTFDEHAKLFEFAKELGVVYYATPLDFSSLDFLVSLGAPIIKIASADITFEPFLKRIAEAAARKDLGVFLSTGFSGWKRITRAFDLLRSSHVALEYCVSKYPPEPSDVDLRVIREMQERYLVPVGFSDHTKGIALSIAAVGMGAKMIERHFTDDPSKQTADHPMSLSPDSFLAMVDGIREVEAALGSGEKRVTDFEKKIERPSMRSIYAAREIKAGETLQESDMLFLRPGDGVKWSDYRRLLGRKASKDMRAYEEF